jgi:membrane protein required for colicin V production
MLIDIVFLIILVLAIFKGLRKGLIVGVFSFFAFMIGLAAALKLSVIVAGYLKDNAGAFSRWLPLLSFMLVFIAVIFLTGLLARLVRRTVRFAMLGWLDRLGGMILYIVIYTIIFSIFLFFAEKLFLVQAATMHESKLYPYISPWGPTVIDNLGKIIPAFKDMFTELQDFFGTLAKKTS